MSILLDALKKSEEQRQLGKVPGIHSTVGGPPEQRAPLRRWSALALLLVCVVALAWFGWRQARSPDAAEGSLGGTAQVAAEPTAAAPEPAPAEDSHGDEPEPRSAVARRTPVESLPEQSGDGPAAETAAAAEISEPRKARVNQSFNAFEAAQEAAMEPSQPSDSGQSDSVSTAQPAAGPPPVAAAQAAPADPKATAPISYWELPQGIRDSLPDLRITVLVYAETPQNRFVLVGGQRLVEKDQYQEGVVLEEIRRDGAVFLYRNYRFLVEG